MPVLVEHLMRQGLLNAQQAQEASAQQALFGDRIGTNLLELGHVTEETLATTLGLIHGVPAAFGAAADTWPLFARCIPRDISARYALLPARLEREGMAVFMLDPYRQDALKAVESALGRRVLPVVVCEARLWLLHDKYLGIRRAHRGLLEAPPPHTGAPSQGAPSAQLPPPPVEDGEADIPLVAMGTLLGDGAAIPVRTRAAGVPQRPGSGEHAPHPFNAPGTLPGAVLGPPPPPLVAPRLPVAARPGFGASGTPAGARAPSFVSSGTPSGMAPPGFPNAGTPSGHRPPAFASPATPSALRPASFLAPGTPSGPLPGMPAANGLRPASQQPAAAPKAGGSWFGGAGAPATSRPSLPPLPAAGPAVAPTPAAGSTWFKRPATAMPSPSTAPTLRPMPAPAGQGSVRVEDIPLARVAADFLSDAAQELPPEETDALVRELFGDAAAPPPQLAQAMARKHVERPLPQQVLRKSDKPWGGDVGAATPFVQLAERPGGAPRKEMWDQVWDAAGNVVRGPQTRVPVTIPPPAADESDPFANLPNMEPGAEVDPFDAVLAAGGDGLELPDGPPLELEGTVPTVPVEAMDVGLELIPVDVVDGAARVDSQPPIHIEIQLDSTPPQLSAEAPPEPPSQDAEEPEEDVFAAAAAAQERVMEPAVHVLPSVVVDAGMLVGTPAMARQDVERAATVNLAPERPDVTAIPGGAAQVVVTQTPVMEPVTAVVAAPAAEDLPLLEAVEAVQEIPATPQEPAPAGVEEAVAAARAAEFEEEASAQTRVAGEVLDAFLERMEPSPAALAAQAAAAHHHGHEDALGMEDMAEPGRPASSFDAPGGTFGAPFGEDTGPTISFEAPDDALARPDEVIPPLIPSRTAVSTAVVGEQPVASQEDAAAIEAAHLEAAKLEEAKLEAARLAAAEHEAAQLEAAKHDAAVLEAARQEAARLETAQEEEARHDAAVLEAARQEAALLEAAQEETARHDAAILEAAQQEAALLASAQQETLHQAAPPDAPIQPQAELDGTTHKEIAPETAPATQDAASASEPEAPVASQEEAPAVLLRPSLLDRLGPVLAEFEAGLQDGGVAGVETAPTAPSEQPAVPAQDEVHALPLQTPLTAEDPSHAVAQWSEPVAPPDEPHPATSAEAPAAQPDAPPPAKTMEPAVPLDVEDARVLLNHIEDRHSIRRALLGVASSMFARSVLVTIHRNVVQGWDAVGEGLDADAVRTITMSLSEPSIFRLVHETGSHILGPLPRQRATYQFVRMLGRVLPRSALVVPVAVRGKVINVLYCDNGAGQDVEAGITNVLIIAAQAGRSYETILASNLAAKAAPAQEASPG